MLRFIGARFCKIALGFRRTELGAIDIGLRGFLRARFHVAEAQPPGRVGAAYVSFEPCARSDWHTHPLGQTLIVTAGKGWVQRAGGPIEEIRPGDVVWFAPGEKHWHGATATTAMSHIAIQEKLNGSPVDWMEKVTDDQYMSETKAA